MVRFAPLLSLALVAFSAAALATPLTPSQVLADTQALQGQLISITGVVSFLKAGTTPEGKPSQSFKLCDADACVQAYTLDTKTYTEGKQITVSGHFWAVKHVGYQVYYNEFDLD